jgi:hypothetical protein
MSDEDSPPEGSPPDESLADAELDTVVGGVVCTYCQCSYHPAYYKNSATDWSVCNGNGWVKYTP